MKTNLIFFLITLLFIFSSCYKELDLEKYQKPPKVVLNSAISTDNVVTASVSKTIFYTETESSNACITDADVELYVNGVFLEKMPFINNTSIENRGLYCSSYVPKNNDLIKILAKTNIGTVWAEDIIPNQIEIDNVEFSYRKYEDSGSIRYLPDGTETIAEKYEIRYSITFTDEANKKNYYCIRIENEHKTEVFGLLDYSSDPVFQDQKSILDGSTANKLIEGQGGRTFSDKLIDGKQYSITILESEQTFFYDWGENIYRRIILYSLSESYYHYLTGLLNVDNSISGNLIEFGFSEPTPFYSNITGGVGILGTVQYSSMVIDLRTIIPQI